MVGTKRHVVPTEGRQCFPCRSVPGAHFDETFAGDRSELFAVGAEHDLMTKKLRSLPADAIEKLSRLFPVSFIVVRHETLFPFPIRRWSLQIPELKLDPIARLDPPDDTSESAVLAESECSHSAKAW